jgi:Tol biopolymer transport system component
LKYNKTGLLKGTYSMGPGKIYTLPLDSPATPVPLLNTNNLGEAKDSIYGFRNPTWSPDGAYIAFWAAGGKSVKPPCASAGNTDIFVTRADGSGLATALTKTPTTSNERVPRWGW